MKKANYKIVSISLILCFVISLTFLASKVITTTNESGQSQFSNTVQIAHDYEEYKDIKTMKKDAGMVFQGTVVKVNKPVKLVEFYISNDKSRPYYAAYTISDIQVEKVIKGKLNPGDIVQIKQLGGFIDDTTWNSQDEPLLTEGKQGVFFTDPYKVNEEYPPSVLMFEQGIFEINDGMVKPNKLQTNLTINAKLNESLDGFTSVEIDDFTSALENLND
jgi:hypothetical protein